MVCLAFWKHTNTCDVSFHIKDQYSRYGSDTSGTSTCRPGAMDFTSRLECNHCFDFSVSFFSQDAVGYLSCPFPAPPVVNTCDGGVSLFWSQYRMCTLDPPLEQLLTIIMCLADYVFLVYHFKNYFLKSTAAS